MSPICNPFSSIFRDLISSSVVVMTGDHNSGYKDKYEQEFNVLRILPHPRYSGTRDGAV
ncbi:hypothetical protein DPMN_025770 [Dreissena polymorpha]|uniref:Uncharacterized protein n=1 Tax=Dreissena polymorpha TaxID=45954 RepID=A0A9D4LTW1_DREPO|nr:hypothetical protein DPMN_025770 [Dreissena polymorpha]